MFRHEQVCALFATLSAFLTAGCPSSKPSDRGQAQTPDTASATSTVEPAKPIKRVVQPTLEQKLTAKEIGYGSEVAISGGRLLVSGDGVHVYDREGTIWNRVGEMKDPRDADLDPGPAPGKLPEPSKEFSLFGSELALSGDTLVVGASFGNKASGAAYVYSWATGERRPARVETLTKESAGEKTSPKSFVGSALAVSKDNIILGAFDAAYVFTRAGQAWKFLEKLRPKQFAPGDRFGSELALDEKRLLVSDPWNGRVHELEQDDGGHWVERGDLSAKESILFGRKVALSGDVAAVTAECRSGSDEQSCVFVFERAKDGKWNEVQKLVAGDSRPRWFGSPVAISDDVIVVGAPGKTERATGLKSGKSLDEGAAYIFQRDDSGKYAQRAVLAGSEIGEKRFATSVSVSGNRLVIGAPAELPAVDPEKLQLGDVEKTNPFESGGNVYIYTLRAGK